MHENYAAAAEFAQTWGLVFFVVLFVIAAGYALWPRNARKFHDAARIPLEDDAPAAATDVQRRADRGQTA